MPEANGVSFEEDGTDRHAQFMVEDLERYTSIVRAINLQR
jgi:hypothetical protein